MNSEIKHWTGPLRKPKKFSIMMPGVRQIFSEAEMTFDLYQQ